LETFITTCDEPFHISEEKDFKYLADLTAEINTYETELCKAEMSYMMAEDYLSMLSNLQELKIGNEILQRQESNTRSEVEEMNKKMEKGMEEYKNIKIQIEKWYFILFYF
jgi:hypothetical protein